MKVMKFFLIKKYNKYLNYLRKIPYYINNPINIFHPKKLLYKMDLFIYFALIFILIIPKINSISKITAINYDNIITLTIKGRGEQSILYEGIRTENNIRLPDKIQINGNDFNRTINYKLQDLTSEENIITLIWEGSIIVCTISKNMFKNVKNMINIDLLNFDFSSVTSLESFFEGCTSLKSVDLSNFDFTNVLTMKLMFSKCSSLVSVNFNNLKTNNTQDLSNLFEQCTSLITIDMSSFNTPNILYLSNCFSGCTSIKSINLNNIYTGKAIYMDAMFNNCKALLSLDLSNFNTKLVQKMNHMFNQCNSLKL